MRKNMVLSRQSRQRMPWLICYITGIKLLTCKGQSVRVVFLVDLLSIHQLSPPDSQYISGALVLESLYESFSISFSIKLDDC